MTPPAARSGAAGSDGDDAVTTMRTGRDPWVVAPLGDVAPGGVVGLDADTTHHLRRVLRRRDGDGLVVADGAGRLAAGTLAAAGVQVATVAEVPPPTVRLRVVQGLAKRARHDEVVRMLTELGVDHVTAATTQRCQVDIAHKRDRVAARWESIVTSACAQARRAHRPVVDGPEDLAAALPGPLERVLVAHPVGGLDPLAAIASLRDPEGAPTPRPGASPPARVGAGSSTWTAVVGPEGGLADDEVADLVDRGAVVVSLGPNVLRTEHAGLALAAIMAAALGRM